MRVFLVILLFVFFLLGSSTIVEAQKKKTTWPNVEYTSVKGYLFNFTKSERFDHRIFKEGKLAKSVLEKTYEISDEKAQEVLKIINSDMDITKTLIMGLSKCFLPRHAIVFYNGDEPVAYIDMCFECLAIRLSPSVEIDYDKITYSKKKNMKAEKTMTRLQMYAESLGMPYFESQKEYAAYERKLNEKKAADNTRDVFLFDYNFAGKVFPKKPTQEVIKAMLPDTSAIKTDNNIEIAAGGDKYVFPEILYKNSRFMFSDESIDAKLAEASIRDSEIVLMDKIKVGMPTDAFLANFVYDGPEFPGKVEVGDPQKNRVFTFIFESNKLKEIKIVAYNW